MQLSYLWKLFNPENHEFSLESLIFSMTQIITLHAERYVQNCIYTVLRIY